MLLVFCLLCMALHKRPIHYDSGNLLLVFRVLPRLINCWGLVGLCYFIFFALTLHHFFLRFSHPLKFLLPLNEFVLTLPCHILPASVRNGLCLNKGDLFFSFQKKPQRHFTGSGGVLAKTGSISESNVRHLAIHVKDY